jgi:hypothetical protein
MGRPGGRGNGGCWGGDFSQPLRSEWSLRRLACRFSIPTADLDGDGVTNGDERIWGLDPTSASSFKPIETPLNPVTGVFRYTRRDRTLTGLTYTVWTSTNLQDWTEDSEATQLPGAPNEKQVETVEVTLSAGLLGNPSLFVRVGAAE